MNKAKIIDSWKTEQHLTARQGVIMRKFETFKQAHQTLSMAFRMRLTVGKTGDISEKLASELVESGCYKATFFGFDDAGNNIVVFKFS